MSALSDQPPGTILFLGERGDLRLKPDPRMSLESKIRFEGIVQLAVASAVREGVAAGALRLTGDLAGVTARLARVEDRLWQLESASGGDEEPSP